MRTKTLRSLCCVLCLLTPGCTTKYLVFATYTKSGLEFAVSDGTPTQLTFGYKRFEGAIVPVDVCLSADGSEARPDKAALSEAKKETGTQSGAKKEKEGGDPCAAAGNTQPEAMSVYAAMDVKNSWLGGLAITQLFATGESAVNAANDPEGFARLVHVVATTGTSGSEDSK